MPLWVLRWRCGWQHGPADPTGSILCWVRFICRWICSCFSPTSFSAMLDTTHRTLCKFLCSMPQVPFCPRLPAAVSLYQSAHHSFSTGSVLWLLCTEPHVLAFIGTLVRCWWLPLAPIFSAIKQGIRCNKRCSRWYIHKEECQRMSFHHHLDLPLSLWRVFSLLFMESFASYIYLFIYLFLRQVLFCSSGDLGFVILLLLPPKGWDYLSGPTLRTSSLL
jgi:hypothetical protein